MVELDPQESCLKTIQSLVIAGVDMLTVIPPAKIAQPSYLAREKIVIRADCAAIAQSSKVLGWIERERRRGSERSSPVAAVTGAMRLSGVLENEQPMRLRDCFNRRHIAGLPV
jgi:hypothetical protein